MINGCLAVDSSCPLATGVSPADIERELAGLGKAEKGSLFHGGGGGGDGSGRRRFARRPRQVKERIDKVFSLVAEPDLLAAAVRMRSDLYQGER
jgi:hypothetical protein